MSNHAFSKDSQNPYSTGVLVGNHTEDRFGQEITSKPVIIHFVLFSDTYLFIEKLSTCNNRVTF